MWRQSRGEPQRFADHTGENDVEDQILRSGCNGRCCGVVDGSSGTRLQQGLPGSAGLCNGRTITGTGATAGRLAARSCGRPSLGAVQQPCWPPGGAATCSNACSGNGRLSAVWRTSVRPSGVRSPRPADAARRSVASDAASWLRDAAAAPLPEAALSSRLVTSTKRSEGRPNGRPSCV